MSDEDYGHRAAQAAFATRALLILTVALLGALFYLLVSVSGDTNRIVDNVETQQDDNTDKISASQQTLDRVNDCTEPGGKCYEDGAERTANAVGNIGRLSVYASACAADSRLLEQTLEQRADSIERCVTRLLDRFTQPQGESHDPRSRTHS